MDVIKPLKIGTLTLPVNVVSAPLAGVADSAFRTISREFGSGLVYSEMISAKGVHYGSQGSVDLFRHRVIEEPFAVQIFGSEPIIMAEAAKLFESMGAAIIDINMGCPVPKIVGNHEGSYLLNEPQLVGEIVETVANAVKIPVTVKMRRGFKSENEVAPEIAQICENSGAAAVTVHGRFRDQYYAGESDFGVIARVKNSVKIPVIASGDINSQESAEKVFGETGCDGVMIGRGALGRPWVFREIITGEPTEISDNDLKEIIFRHLEYEIQDKGEYTAVREIRKHIAWYVKGKRGAAALKNAAFAANTKEDLIKMLSQAL